jgi:hypothetical protein
VRNGRSYTEQVFNWADLVDRYDVLVARVLAGTALRTTVTPG